MFLRKILNEKKQQKDRVLQLKDIENYYSDITFMKHFKRYSLDFGKNGDCLNLSYKCTKK